MFHTYTIRIKCQGCHNTSFQLTVFTADISSHSYQRAPRPTAPVRIFTIKTVPMLVSLAEMLWIDEALRLPRSSWCHIYVLHVSTMWNKQVYEPLWGHSRRIALKDALHSAVPAISCVSVWANRFIVSSCLHSYQWDVCSSSGFREPRHLGTFQIDLPKFKKSLSSSTNVSLTDWPGRCLI